MRLEFELTASKIATTILLWRATEAAPTDSASKVRLAPHPFSPFRSSPVDPVVNLVVVKPRALHQLHLGAFRADDIVAVGDKATSDQRSFAARADETIVMPVPVLE